MFDFNTKKKKFINKWKSVSILNLEGCLSDFGNDFHIKLLEEIIEYVFNLLTSKNKKKDTTHNFYIKMLYFYDIYKLILWNHLIPDDALKSKYSKYVTNISLKLTGSNKLTNEKKPSNDINTNILVDTLNKNSKNWVSTGMINNFNQNVKEIDRSIYVKNKNSSEIQRVRADLLPVGHFLDKTPKIYDPALNMWSDYNFTINQNIKENNIIIGYDKRSTTGIFVKFKLREPRIVKKDVRKVEKGSVCSTKSKAYLTDIAKKLGIDNDKDAFDTSVDNLCEMIRAKLIYLELKENEKPNGVKYFYNIFEQHL